MINIYIRTRGWTTDYSFLLQQKPEIPDWNYYRSDIEKPTCILEGTGENQVKVELFLSGIPSVRKDYQGTPIYYDLVAEIDYNSSDESGKNDCVKGFTGLIWIWLNDVITEFKKEDNRVQRFRLPLAGESKLGASLDNILSEKYVEELLQLTSDSEELEDKKDKLNDKLEQLILKKISPESISSELTVDIPTWWGGVNNDKSCQQWIALVEKLLQGKTKGKALLLNIANPPSLGRLAVKHEELGVLLGSEFSGSEPEEIEIKQARENNRTRLSNFMKNKAATGREQRKQFFNSVRGRVKKKRP